MFDIEMLVIEKEKVVRLMICGVNIFWLIKGMDVEEGIFFGNIKNLIVMF